MRDQNEETFLSSHQLKQRRARTNYRLRLRDSSKGREHATDTARERNGENERDHDGTGETEERERILMEGGLPNRCRHFFVETAPPTEPCGIQQSERILKRERKRERVPGVLVRRSVDVSDGQYGGLSVQNEPLQELVINP